MMKKYIFLQSGESPEFGIFTAGEEVMQTISQIGIETLTARGVIEEVMDNGE